MVAGLVGLVGWLTRQAVSAGRKRFDDPVGDALARVIRDAVQRAVNSAAMDADRDHTIALLLESPIRSLPAVDGSPLAHLSEAVRAWVATIEHPVEEDGSVPLVGDDHPLVRPLCDEILRGIQAEATRSSGILYPLWDDYQRAMDKKDLLRRLDSEHVDAPVRIDYWHPPVPRVAFVGREAELAWLAGSDDGIPVRLLHGVGGVGKTALALEHARRVVDAYPGGRVFLDFQSYSKHADYGRKSALHALAELLPRFDVDDRRVAAMDLEQRVLAWKHAISGRQMLFVWDNVRSIDQVEPLLTGQPGCLTLITSRSEIDLTARSLQVEPMSREEAVRLFVAIAGDRHQVGVESLVTRAAQLCAWIPLQILVHATRVRRKRTLAELVAELEALPSDARLADLFTSLDLSYRDLSEGAQQAWRALGAHPGPYVTAGTVKAMLDCPVEEATQFLDEIVDAGLAERYHGGFDVYGGGHEIPSVPSFFAYNTHDMLRDYAEHKAALAPAELQEMVFRLLDYYHERIESEPDRAWLQVERTGLVVALWLAGPTESAAELARLAGMRLRVAGWYTEAEAADQHALELYRAMGIRAGEAYALWSVAQRHVLLGSYDQAEALLHEALTINRELSEHAEESSHRDSQRGEAYALLSLGLIAAFRNEHERSSGLLREGLLIRRSLGDRKAEFEVLHHLAILNLTNRLDLDQAAKDARELYRTSQALGERERAAALLLLGQVRLAQGSMKRATYALDSAYKIFNAIGHRHGQANSLYELAGTALARSDRAKAERLHLRALAIYREIGDRQGVVKTHMGLAEVAAARDDLDLAEELFTEVYLQYVDMKNILGQAGALQQLAWVAMGAGRRDVACARLQDALRTLQAIDSPLAETVRQQLAQWRCPTADTSR